MSESAKPMNVMFWTSLLGSGLGTEAAVAKDPKTSLAGATRLESRNKFAGGDCRLTPIGTSSVVSGARGGARSTLRPASGSAKRASARAMKPS